MPPRRPARRRRLFLLLVLLFALVILPPASHSFLLPSLPPSSSPSPPLPSRPPLHASSSSLSYDNDNDDAPRYNARGVSATKEEVLVAVGKSTSPASASLYPRTFCKILPDLWHPPQEGGEGDNQQSTALIMHADGAGSKAALAYAYWKETGDLSVWKGIAQDALVMNLDDVYCVGATKGPALLTSTIARNRRLVPGEVVTALIQGMEEILEELRPWGVDVRLAGGETADLGDQVRTLTVDCTLATRMERRHVIDNGRIQAGDLIVGLASGGSAAKFETKTESKGKGKSGVYNSGIGSNGLTAARHDVLNSAVGQKYPETYDPALGPELAYCGSRSLTERIQLPGGREMTVGQLLLSPTRTYAPVLARLLGGEEDGEGDGGAAPAGRQNIHGIVHCSGGGQTKVLRCLDPAAISLHIIKDALFEVPPVFRLIFDEQQKQRQKKKNNDGNDGAAAAAAAAAATAAAGEDEAAWREMYQVFNMGHRLELYVGGGQEEAERVIAVAQSLGVEAKVVGRVEEGGGRGGERGEQHVLTIEDGEGRVFVYK